VVTLAIELPKKIESTFKLDEVEKPKLQPLAGAIRSESNDPLSDVQVSLPQFNLTRATDQLGQFRFEVSALQQDTVALLAQKPGYQTYEADVTLGNTSLGFTMRRQEP
uniref:carboxypeptidase-like regulatory domain-containing protein n=1 Tax=Streptobacillus moniliformis TaxID=34105 RepID=UPI0012DB649B